MRKLRSAIVSNVDDQGTITILLEEQLSQYPRQGR